MRRCWIGAGLLGVLLALSLTAGWAMETVHMPVAEALHQAASAQDWDRAKALAERAEKDWEKWQCLRLCLADHTPVEDVDAQFAALKNYREEDEAEFAALAREMGEKVRAIGQAHSLSMGSFF